MATTTPTARDLSALRRSVAAWHWPDVHRAYRAGRGVTGFTCAGHGGMVATLDATNVRRADPDALANARAAGLVQTWVAGRFIIDGRLRRFAPLGLWYAHQGRVLALSDWSVDVLVAEEDCDWRHVVRTFSDAAESSYFAGPADDIRALADRVAA